MTVARREEVVDVEGLDAQSGPSLSADVVRFSAIELRRGPIPDADELARYGRAHPDAPLAILTEFQLQGEHRRRVEREEQRLGAVALQAAIVSERMGVLCGLVIALVGFASATYLVAAGHGLEGTAIAGIDVGAITSAFILGRPRLAPRRIR
jgi:uncharacterized membrane protein